MESGVNVFLPETRYEFSMYTNVFIFSSTYYVFCYLEAYRLTDFTSHITPLPVSVVNIRFCVQGGSNTKFRKTVGSV